MSDTSAKSSDAPDDFGSATTEGSMADAEPIEAEFREADPAGFDGTGGQKGPGWTGAIALAVLAAVGGSVGGTVGGQLLTFMPRAETNPSLGGATALDELSGTVAALESRLVAVNAAVEARLDATGDRAAETAEALSEIRQDLAATGAQIEKVDRIATFDRRLAALETASEEAAGGETAPATVALSALSARVEALETSTAALSRATDALAAATDSVDFASIDETLGRLERDLEAFGAQTTELVQTVAADPDTQDTGLDPALALALADITRALGDGEPFQAPHADLAAALPNDEDVAALAPLAAPSAPTLDQLIREFTALQAEALAADPDEPEGGVGLAERIFGDQIKVRRDGQVSVEDELARAKTALAKADLQAALEALEPLPLPVADVLAPWVADAERRLSAERALDGLRLTLAAKQAAANSPALSSPPAPEGSEPRP
ncbi:MAG: hypothetical protein AAGJ32_03980 [Pseudomonadota bacterium]